MALDTNHTLLAAPTDMGGLLYAVDPETVVDNIFVFSIGDVKYRRVVDGAYRAAWAITGPTGDQTARLQAVFDHADIQEVVFDDGDVLISGTLTVPAGKYVSFKGNGRVVGGGTGIINGGKYRWLKASYYNAITLNPELVYASGSGGGAGLFSGVLLYNPTLILSAICPDADRDTVVVTFNKDMSAVTLAGFSFAKEELPWVASGVSGSGAIWTFTMAEPALLGNALFISYDPVTGATLGADEIELSEILGTAIDNQIFAIPFPHNSQFTGPNGTLLGAYVPDTGNVWAGTGWEIQSNKAVPTVPTAGNGVNADTGPTQDYTIRLVYTKAAGGAELYVGFRMGIGKGVLCVIQDAALYVYDVIAAGGSTIGSFASSLLERELILVVSGNSFDAYIDGVAVATGVAFNAGNNGTGVSLSQASSATSDFAVNSFKVIPTPFPHISNFTAANGTLVHEYTPDDGGPWTAVQGTWEIQGNKALPIYGGVDPYMSIDIAPRQNFALRAVYTLDSTSPYFSISLRAGGGVGITLLVLHSTIYMVDTPGGFSGPIASFASLTGADREVRFVVNGTTLDSYIDGVAVDTGRAIHAANIGTIIQVGQANVALTAMSLNSLKVEAS
jgi:hypothetical protein